jgi:hypothetical protein
MTLPLPLRHSFTRSSHATQVRPTGGHDRAPHRPRRRSRNCCGPRGRIDGRRWRFGSLPLLIHCTYQTLHPYCSCISLAFSAPHLVVFYFLSLFTGSGAGTAAAAGVASGAISEGLGAASAQQVLQYNSPAATAKDNDIATDTVTDTDKGIATGSRSRRHRTALTCYRKPSK